MGTNQKINKKSLTFAAMMLSLAIAACAEGTAFARSVELRWNANNEPNHGGYKVYYVDAYGAALQSMPPIDLGNVTTATISGLDSGADYHFAVTAYNNAGLESTFSRTISYPAIQDTNPPSVALTSPVSSSIVGGEITVSVVASDDSGIKIVEVYQDDTLLTAANLSPLNFKWNTTSLSNGTHILTAKAYDTAGNVTISSLPVTVMNDKVSPLVSISSLPNGTATGLVTIGIDASDNVAVGKVEFLLNGVVQGTSTSAPYSFNWNTASLANGTYTLSAKAYDAAGNIGQSASVAVNVLNDTIAPTVNFIAPSSTYVYGSSVNIKASATDNVSVARMELYIDGSLQFSTTSSSFNFGYKLGMGKHTLTIKAYDASNNVNTTSKAVTRYF